MKYQRFAHGCLIDICRRVWITSNIRTDDDYSVDDNDERYWACYRRIELRAWRLTLTLEWAL